MHNIIPLLHKIVVTHSCDSLEVIALVIVSNGEPTWRQHPAPSTQFTVLVRMMHKGTSLPVYMSVVSTRGEVAGQWAIPMAAAG